MPLSRHEERRANDRAYLCFSTVDMKHLTFSRDDCLAVFCFVNRDWLSPPRKNKDIIAQNRRVRTRQFENQRLRRFVRLDLTGEFFSRLRQ